MEIVAARHCAIYFTKKYVTRIVGIERRLETLVNIGKFYNRVPCAISSIISSVEGKLSIDVEYRRMYERIEQYVLRATTEDLSDDEYQYLTSEALKFQTNQ
jgi:hypothetical protein